MIKIHVLLLSMNFLLNLMYCMICVDLMPFMIINILIYIILMQCSDVQNNLFTLSYIMIIKLC